MPMLGDTRNCVAEHEGAAKSGGRGVVTRRHTLEAMYCVTVLVTHLRPSTEGRWGGDLPHRPVCRPAMVTIMALVEAVPTVSRSVGTIFDVVHPVDETGGGQNALREELIMTVLGHGTV